MERTNHTTKLTAEALAKAGRNEESCKDERRIVGIPVIVEMMIVPVPLIIVQIQIKNVPITVRTPKKYTRHHPFHTNPQSASKAGNVFGIYKCPSASYQVSSIF